MEFGASIFFTDYSISPAALGVALEERGFDSLWAAEHSHIPVPRRTPPPGGGELAKRYYDVMDPFVTLTAAAAATKKLKVATGICLVIQRDTIQTAKLVASIDQVSGGRFLFGIGGGWNAEEIEAHGTVFTTRMQKMREQMEAMKEIWTKSTAEYNGQIVKVPSMQTWPKPTQKPYPPILLGGAFPWAARRAIRYGDGWYPNASSGNPEEYLPRFPPDGDRSRARSAVVAGDARRRARGSGQVAAVPRAWRCAGERDPAGGGRGSDPAHPGPLGRIDPPTERLIRRRGVAPQAHAATPTIRRMQATAHASILELLDTEGRESGPTIVSATASASSSTTEPRDASDHGEHESGGQPEQHQSVQCLQGSHELPMRFQKDAGMPVGRHGAERIEHCRVHVGHGAQRLIRHRPRRIPRLHAVPSPARQRRP